MEVQTGSLFYTGSPAWLTLWYTASASGVVDIPESIGVDIPRVLRLFEIWEIIGLVVKHVNLGFLILRFQGLQEETKKSKSEI